MALRSILTSLVVDNATKLYASVKKYQKNQQNDAKTKKNIQFVCGLVRLMWNV